MVYNKETVVRKLKDAFAFGADVTAACAFAEISRETFYTWCKEDPRLKEQSDRLREKPILKAYMTVAKDLDKVESAKWYLERKRKREFSTRSELTGKDGEPVIPLLNLTGDALCNNDSDKKDKEPKEKD